MRAATITLNSELGEEMEGFFRIKWLGRLLSSVIGAYLGASYGLVAGKQMAEAAEKAHKRSRQEHITEGR